MAQAEDGSTRSASPATSCPADLEASIIYVSPRAEFTPPVIYSQTARSKLVFLIEARPEADRRQGCSPGLPVTVAPFAK